LGSHFPKQRAMVGLAHPKPWRLFVRNSIVCLRPKTG
jgi:hypothetical protein